MQPTLRGFRSILPRRFIHVARTVAEFRKYRSELPKNCKIGFVPTMGALHDGHISLVQRAVEESDIVAASIFINPSQFSAGEDLDKYPKSFDNDLQLLKSAGVKVVFAPLTSEIYPGKALCHVEPSDFSLIHEGKARPDFFRGVASIVCKLFNIVQPTYAYFGQKDISQGILIRSMVQDLNIPVEIKICETVRETDGLAMSSRNAYLTADERRVSSILYKALSAAEIFVNEQNCQNNDISNESITCIITDILNSEPLVSKIEYISIASCIDMKEIIDVSYHSGGVISSAVRVGSVRLIDNVLTGHAKNMILNLTELDNNFNHNRKS